LEPVIVGKTLSAAAQLSLLPMKHDLSASMPACRYPRKRSIVSLAVSKAYYRVQEPQNAISCSPIPQVKICLY
jgi:hypothetical protein